MYSAAWGDSARSIVAAATTDPTGLRISGASAPASSPTETSRSLVMSRLSSSFRSVLRDVERPDAPPLVVQERRLGDDQRAPRRPILPPTWRVPILPKSGDHAVGRHSAASSLATYSFTARVARCLTVHGRWSYGTRVA